MLALLPYLRYLPDIFNLITTIEQLHGDSLSGADKKKLIMDTLAKTATTFLPGKVTQSELDAISGLIDFAVATASAVGAFGKKKV